LSARGKGKYSVRHAKRSAESKNIVDVLNQIGDEVNSTLNQRKKEKYFQSIVLQYSLIENLLKWLVYMKVVWEKSIHVFKPGEEEGIRHFAKNLNFYSVARVAFVIGLIDYKFFQRLDEIRGRRNDLIHQFWLLTHLDETAVLRKESEQLAKAANGLIAIFNNLMKDVGLEEAYEIFLQEPKHFRS